MQAVADGIACEIAFLKRVMRTESCPCRMEIAYERTVDNANDSVED